ncbi:MAG TPA: DUF1905 domain-containing protein [Chitinophagales bacterium]|nr:DUF1905 domain-containing protein [Chitinophagales bacterium]
MEYIIKDEKLELKHQPGKGAWTYHLRIPNSKDIEGKWGDIKVSGSIDDFKIKARNLAPIKGEDKMLSVNSEIRKAINKKGGDIVTVTLYLENRNTKKNENEIIIECFKDAEVLNIFKKLKIEEQNEIIQSINSSATENQKVEKIVKIIAKLNSLY